MFRFPQAFCSAAVVRNAKCVPSLPTLPYRLRARPTKTDMHTRLTRSYTFFRKCVLSPSNILHFGPLNTMRASKKRNSQNFCARTLSKVLSNFQNWSILANSFKTNNEKHENGRQKQTSTYPCHFVPNQNFRSRFICSHYLLIVKNVVLRWAQMQRSLA